MQAGGPGNPSVGTDGQCTADASSLRTARHFLDFIVEIGGCVTNPFVLHLFNVI